MRKNKEDRYRQVIRTLLDLNIQYCLWLDSSDTSEVGDNQGTNMMRLIRKGNKELKELGFK